MPRAGLLGERRTRELSNSPRLRHALNGLSRGSERTHRDVRAGVPHHGWLLAGDRIAHTARQCPRSSDIAAMSMKRYKRPIDVAFEETMNLLSLHDTLHPDLRRATLRCASSKQSR